MLPRTLILMTILTGCTAFPALNVVNSDQNAPFPTLIPLEPLLAQATTGTLNPNPGLGSRVDQLNARANGLRGQIIDPATLARMQAGVDTTALQ